MSIVVMQLLWFWFKLVSSLALLIITQQIRGNQGIVVGFTSKSNGQVTSIVVLVLVCVQPSRFQSNWCDWCYFAPHWFVKISKLFCDYLRNSSGFGFVTAIWKLFYLSIPIQGYTVHPCRVVYKSRQPGKFPGFSARFRRLLSLLHESKYVKEMDPQPSTFHKTPAT